MGGDADGYIPDFKHIVFRWYIPDCIAYIYSKKIAYPDATRIGWLMAT